MDGVLARDGNWSLPEVLRLGNSDLVAVIDLGEKTEIRKVVARFIYQQEAGIFPATRVEVSLSDEGSAFKAASTATFEAPNNRAERGVTIKELVVEPAASGRYVKVLCKNIDVLPAWHEYPGVPGHMMMDEILVNPADEKK